MYLRYIYKLHDLHLSAENYTEAAFTLKLYADQLAWNSNQVTDPNYPNHTECQVKEMLYRQIINYFDKGKVTKIFFVSLNQKFVVIWNILSRS